MAITPDSDKEMGKMEMVAKKGKEGRGGYPCMWAMVVVDVSLL